MHSSSIQSVKYYLCDEILAIRTKKIKENSLEKEKKQIENYFKSKEVVLFEEDDVFGREVGEIIYRRNKKFEQIPIQINGEASSILLPEGSRDGRVKNLIIAPEMIEKEEKISFHKEYTIFHKYTYGYMIEYYGTSRMKNGFKTAKERNEEVRKITNGTWDFEKPKNVLTLQYQQGEISVNVSKLNR